MRFQDLSDEKQHEWYVLLVEQARLIEQLWQLKRRIADWIIETKCDENPAFTPSSIQRALSRDVEPLLDEPDVDLWTW